MAPDATPLDLDAIQARCEAATPGPWQLDGPWWWNDRKCSGMVSAGGARDAVVISPHGQNDANERFIAAARTDVPALVVLVERLRRLMRMFHDPESCRYPQVECSVCEVMGVG